VLANTRVRAMQEVVPHLYAVINPEDDALLAFTAMEGTTIAKLFSYSTRDEGRMGTRQRVMSNARGQTYLHFSCHGRYNWSTPTASGLILADGDLTLAELQQGDIDLSVTRLVTLSACETGIVDVVHGSAEEYVSLPAGFMLAGIPCVISSLWSVPDLSTALLMERFYHNHLKSRMEFAAALCEAQEWVRTLKIGAVVEYAEQSIRKSSIQLSYRRHYRSLASQDPDLCPFSHPYFWAAFTVNGV
jgi:CHAT domain-containing protein